MRHKRTRKALARSFQEQCNARRGQPWDEVRARIKARTGKRKVSVDREAKAILKQAVNTYKNPICLKDVAARTGMRRAEVSRKAKNLESAGYCSRKSLSVGRRRKTFIQPTAKGFKLVGEQSPPEVGRGGIAHRYCVAKVEKHLQTQGYTTEREVEVKGKRVDVVARKGTHTILVEAELSSQNAARNAAADLQVMTQKGRILVVSPTKKVLRKVKGEVKTAVGETALSRFQFTALADL